MNLKSLYASGWREQVATLYAKDEHNYMAQLQELSCSVSLMKTVGCGRYH